MSIGKLRQRIDIQTLSDTPTGGSTGSAITRAFTTVASIWAKVDTVKGLVQFDTKQIGEGNTNNNSNNRKLDFIQIKKASYS
jgi:hypothetical protein